MVAKVSAKTGGLYRFLRGVGAGPVVDTVLVLLVAITFTASFVVLHGLKSRSQCRPGRIFDNDREGPLRSRPAWAHVGWLIRPEILLRRLRIFHLQVRDCHKEAMVLELPFSTGASDDIRTNLPQQNSGSGRPCLRSSR
jgi:hypothetical protein